MTDSNRAMADRLSESLRWLRRGRGSRLVILESLLPVALGLCEDFNIL